MPPLFFLKILIFCRKGCKGHRLLISCEFTGLCNSPLNFTYVSLCELFSDFSHAQNINKCDSFKHMLVHTCILCDISPAASTYSILVQMPPRSFYTLYLRPQLLLITLVIQRPIHRQWQVPVVYNLLLLFRCIINQCIAFLTITTKMC